MGQQSEQQAARFANSDKTAAGRTILIRKRGQIFGYVEARDRTAAGLGAVTESSHR
jgi:hypothetical protein